MADIQEGRGLEFLNEPDGINKFLDDLFSFNIVILRNSDHDPIVLKLMDPLQIKFVIDDYFQSGVKTELIVENGKKDILCPYFKFIMKDYSTTHPVNYKLETFFRQTGILGVHARCSTAIIVGMMSDSHGKSCVDVPMEYHYLSCRPLGFMAPLDMSLTGSIARKRCLDKINGISGMSLPYCLPAEVHWNILKYLRHPCAELILDHKQKLLAWCAHWDHHFAYVIRSSHW